MIYIKKFKDLTIEDVPVVGGKNASLGQMIRELSKMGVAIPDGFAVTAKAYWGYLKYNRLNDKIKDLLNQLSDPQDIENLQRIGKEIRRLIATATMPDDIKEEIKRAYQELSSEYNKEAIDVAVRSSATAEDLPDASFAGQQETYLNIKGDEELIESCKKCFASLFTDRAIIYRITKGFDHSQVALSIGVQKMVRSDLSCAGVAFSLDTESGFKDVVMIEAAYGLGEVLVKGEVTPDEYRVFKPMLEKGYQAIISKKVGNKTHKLIYGKKDATDRVDVSKEEQRKFCLKNEEIIELSKAVITIEKHYSEIKGRWMPMDVEWAKDGQDGKIYIVQARPETVHSIQDAVAVSKRYQLQKNRKDLEVLVQGLSIGQKISSGRVRLIDTISQAKDFQQGDFIVTEMTDPDWVPLMKKSGGIITDLGGRTCHAAIVSRELGIPAIVGTHDATKILKEDQEVTLDSSQGSTGYVYDGLIPYEIVKTDLSDIQKPAVDLMVNMADPAGAFPASKLPFVVGVGLARIEFIIANTIKAHPMALLEPEKVKEPAIKKELDELTQAYPSKKEFFINELAHGIATIAAAFYPRIVLVRFSDFKTSEYRNLIGGEFFEPEENNPMLGLRGASRYRDQLYAPAFSLEIEAIKRVREEIGLDNVSVMVPFVRTVAEGESVVAMLKEHSLPKSRTLKYFMMVEIPSNVLLFDKFAPLFDGFSIGSNDLTQFTLAVDRDSGLLSETFDERDEAVKELMKLAVLSAQKHKKYIGICGQAPSDYSEIREFLIDLGINSLSLNPDAVIPFLLKGQV